MTPEQFDSQLDLFHSGASANRTTVYARLRQPPTGEGFSLSGTIRGPHCLYSTTLPATLRMRDAGPGATLLAKTLVPDPCYWTPDLPFLYDVRVELKRGAEVVASAERLLGVRDFGLRGQFFYDQGKRRVIRAVRQEACDERELLAWHDAATAMFVVSPAEELCHEASRSGVMLIATVESKSAVEEVRRLSRHAAVALVCIRGEYDVKAIAEAAGNLDVAKFIPAGEPFENAPIAVVECRDGFPVHKTESPALIAYRRLADRLSLADARAACDQLQADLAPAGDFAGYVV
jgi:hypothetical protein